MGNTPVTRIVTGLATVHPHTHGEHARYAHYIGSVIGSSPHAWGTRSDLMIGQHERRFIPTRMGNTPTRQEKRPCAPVHPHTHGEHIESHPRRQLRNGSSPHAWGTPHRQEAVCEVKRFIPTRMGNTFIYAPYFISAPVHPHTHGEHQFPTRSQTPVSGSSPHAWGTHGHKPDWPLDDRFIPTRMGNTVCRRRRILPTPVHPHTHGEHGIIPRGAVEIDGSSPHAWGTRNPAEPTAADYRFIPTRMGNT